MISLSYTTLNMLHTANHNWVNKMLGRIVPDRPEFRHGRLLHRIIQDHVSGIKTHPVLKIPYTFDVVEVVDFDIKCKIKVRMSNKYEVIGYLDGFNTVENTSLEIKTGTKMWSLGQFQRSKQRCIYSLGKRELRENILITCNNYPCVWEHTPPKIYKIPVIQKDLDDAMTWIEQGIKIIEKGYFGGGLTDGRCLDPRCYYGDNCFFKNNVYKEEQV